MKFVKTFAEFAIALALAAGCPPAAMAAMPADPVARLLAESRAALGGAAMERVKTLELEGTVSFGGMSGKGSSWLEIGGTRFSESYDTPPLSGGDGFDGTDAWNSDDSGLVWVDGGQAGRAQAISQAFLNDNALWGPNRGGATVHFAGVKQDAGRSYDVLQITAPQSLVPFELWFDRTTHLPARFVQTIGPTTTVSTFSNYKPVDGLMIPRTNHTQSSDGNSGDSTVTQAIANPADAAGHLAKPASNVHDFSIAGGAASTTIPIELVDNHVYLSVMLNGKGPYRFIYDTGGANIVDPAVAQEIGAAGHGSIQGGGVGSTTESVSFAKVASMQIGDATVRNQLFGVAPTRMGFGLSSGRPVDGLIGFEVLSRFITTFDYAGKSVTLAMPGNAPAAPSASKTSPFVLDGRQPQFACGIDGVDTQCTLDTGARDSITLFGPFLTAHPQVVPATLSGVGVTGFGFGGPAFGKLGRIASVAFGGFTLPEVIGDFTTQTKGAFAAPFIAANVGGNLFRRFTLTLDYAKQTMTLTPNAAFGERDTYERAGLFLLNRDGKYLVLDARPGTPAADAGLVKGDTIVSVDGKPAAGMTLQQVRELFYGVPGTAIRMTVTGKDGTSRDVIVTLRDYV